MENNSFRKFLDTYLEIWRNSSLTDLKKVISEDYNGIEILNGETVNITYEESLDGWEQGFNFAKEKGNEWELKEISVVPLRKNEVMAIVSATLIIAGKKLENVSIFLQTFKRQENYEWKLIRSYIETGGPAENISKIHFK